MQIKDEEALTYPGKLKGDPNRHSKDKYCRFHRDHGHDTADCYDLKQQIETLIKQGKLQRFVRKERTDQPPQEQNPRRDNERPKPPIGDIRMILGGTAVIGLSKKGSEDLSQDGPECSVDGLSAEDSTKGKPHNRILGGGCKTPSPPT